MSPRSHYVLQTPSRDLNRRSASQEISAFFGDRKFIAVQIFCYESPLPETEPDKSKSYPHGLHFWSLLKVSCHLRQRQRISPLASVSKPAHRPTPKLLSNGAWLWPLTTILVSRSRISRSYNLTPPSNACMAHTGQFYLLLYFAYICTLVSQVIRSTHDFRLKCYIRIAPMHAKLPAQLFLLIIQGWSRRNAPGVWVAGNMLCSPIMCAIRSVKYGNGYIGARTDII
jgi:hypothetical protein